MPADLRPRLHVQAPSNWVNDPNGPIFYNGAYHLFFQRHPYSPDWGPPHWGHAVSDDLVRWRVLGDALVPTPGGPDSGGCWSGCTVEIDGLVHAVYTGIDPAGRQVVCVARSSGDLTTWEKVPEAVIVEPPAGMELVGFRDPYVIADGAGGWWCVMGAGIASRRGLALLYRSADLMSWEYAGQLLERDCSLTEPIATGEMWECPQLFTVDGHDVLGISMWHQGELNHTAHFLGTFEGERFAPSSLGKLDHGPDFYAATSMADQHGRRLLWAWSWEALTDEARRAGGVAGCLTLPREISVQDGRLRSRPAGELDALRGPHVGHGEGALGEGSPVTVSADAGRCFDAEFEIVCGKASRVDIAVYASADDDERVTVFLEPGDRQAGVDTTRSSLRSDVRTGVFTASLPLDPDRSVPVRIIADGSILEVFIDGTPFTARVYPTRPDSRAVRIDARGPAELVRADVWTIDERPVEFAE